MDLVPNQLIHETSPYLRQHSHNPIAWLPWGEAALARSVCENKPIFLSIGYSACHWCHVMERDSFMDGEVARFLNEHFIPIKVDREERPDIDHIYMTALQVMTGSGGWPLNLFLTPNAEPFYGGTFFTKEDQGDTAGFLKILKTLVHHWETEEESILRQSRHLTQHIKAELDRPRPAVSLPMGFELLKQSVAILHRSADLENGGFYGAPKFPQPFLLELYVLFLKQASSKQGARLSVQGASEEQEIIESWRKHLACSLAKMAQGGMYDQIGGGFHRYSTDPSWTVPHFEKMLYDNAILSSVYLRAAELCGPEFQSQFESIGLDICDYVLRDMTDEGGGFFSSTDADSAGVEGLFFVWNRDELRLVLGEEEEDFFSEIYGITVEQNIPNTALEGSTPPHDWFLGRVPCLSDSVDKKIADFLKRRSEFSPEMLARQKVRLLELKSKVLSWRNKNKPRPFLDEKILLSWNALMASSMVLAYRRTGLMSYLHAAKKNIDLLLRRILPFDEDSSIQDLSTSGAQDPVLTRTLEDYAYLALACFDLDEEGMSEYYQAGRTLIEKAIVLFDGGDNKAFYYSSSESKDLILRSKNLFDHALPSPNAVLIRSLIYLRDHCCLGGPEYLRYEKMAQGIFAEISPFMVESPQSVSTFIREYALAK